METVVYKQLAKIAKKEQRQFNEKTNLDIAVFTKKIEAKIPPTLRDKLEQGFCLGFRVVFQNGTGFIEKTYHKEKYQAEYEIGDYVFERLGNKKGLRAVSAGSHRRHFANLGATALEGAGLGILGIGLPDIPIFIGVLLKSIYETAMSYGFSYSSDGEKYYILLLIESSLGSGMKKQKLYDHLEEVAAKLDGNVAFNFDLDEQIRLTAQSLANDLLVMKFIQGLPLVGVVGGATNVVYCHKITDFAKMKYQKRYLLKKVK
ncbi:MAG: EcsC family protein [Clostridiales bacterium]